MTLFHSPSIIHRLQFLAEGEFMAILKGLASIVSELKVERTNLANQLRHLDAALTVLGKMNGGTSYTRPGRSLAASARRRISVAQKARRAKSRDESHATAGESVTTSAPTKRTMSAAARQEDRSRSKETLGEVEGCEENGSLEPGKPAAGMRQASSLRLTESFRYGRP